ncbi:MAG: hypothetical protein JNL28_13860 [Planctomycetes bacterium]|nr:hypothetical protein [Planctomycetota bacterium]
MNIQRTPAGTAQTNAASQTQRTPLTHKNVAAKQAAQSQPVQAAATQESKPQAMNPRLAAYAEKIDARLSQAIENKDNSPRQKAALEAAKTHFHSMVGRLDQAFLADGRAKIDMTPGQGMSKIFEHLTGAVTTVLTHGKVDVQG